MLNGKITSPCIYKEWISISVKIYLLPAFHTSSTSEMDMYKELIYIYVYIYIYIGVNIGYDIYM